MKRGESAETGRECARRIKDRPRRGSRRVSCFKKYTSRHGTCQHGDHVLGMSGEKYIRLTEP